VSGLSFPGSSIVDALVAASGSLLAWSGTGWRMNSRVMISAGSMTRSTIAVLYANMQADPVRTVAIVVFLIIVVVKVWAYIVLGVIALTAIRAYRHR
jgi:hypothetical protein